VKKGDTLEKIGRRFDLSVGDLARINAFAREREPDPGELLVVYVDAKHKRGTVAAPEPLLPPAAVASDMARAETPAPSASGGKTTRVRARRSPSTPATSRLPGNKAP
jgi:membrane-bound lytic murein transglycosylase D